MPYEGLNALFINCTLKRSPTRSHTQGLIELSRRTMESQGVQTDSLRIVDFTIPPGVKPDMTEHGYDTDEWLSVWPKIKGADILVVSGPLWVAENSSAMRILLERLYAMSSQLNEKGQLAYYGKVACTLLSGNEDGVKHGAMGNLYALQHLGFTIPPQADAGWLGTIGPGLSYLDEGSGGPENDFTNRNTVFMSWNAMHLAALLKKNDFYPAVGNSRAAWEMGNREGFFPPPGHPIA